MDSQRLIEISENTYRVFSELARFRGTFNVFMIVSVILLIVLIRAVNRLNKTIKDKSNF